MKNINPFGLFDNNFLLETLIKLGDPLQKLIEYINLSIFEAPLDQVFRNETKDLFKGGISPFSKLILFKALIIQTLNNLSDDQPEFQIVDRVSFKRFLGLKKSDKVRDSIIGAVEQSMYNIKELLNLEDVQLTTIADPANY